MQELRKAFMVLFASVIFSMLPSSVFGGPSDVIKGCFDCHGDKGVSKEKDVPTIAGLSDFYHEEQLYAYREKRRPCVETKYRHGDTNRPATDMCKLAEKLTEEQVGEIVVYFAEQKFVPADQPFDAELAKKGAKIHDAECEKCHTEDGSVATDDAGILKGQWMAYMKMTMEDYLAGERDQIDNMKSKMEKLSEEDVKALLHFYASPMTE